jgi:hypothetical protein
MKVNEKVGSCIKERGNWGKLTSDFRFDHKDFNPKTFLKYLHIASPKLQTLLNKIQELDAKDIAEHGRLFKHFIYSDIKSAYGAKLIAAGLNSYGFDHAYHLKAGPRGMSFSLNKSVIGNKNTFATLTSVAFFEKPIGIQFRKELLKVFNSRPDNVHGDQIRIIVLDSGFREGIDLFDIKYVHLFEPIATLSDQKQAIGRATRFCGQKGLRFDPLTGWPIHVFRYQTIVPEDIQRYLLKAKDELAPADTFFNLFLKFSNIDPKKIQFANQLEQVVTSVAVDRVFTQNIHQFKIQSVKGGQSMKYGKHFEKFQEAIEKKYRGYTWPPVKIENMCGGASIVSFSPTQDFIRHYFTPKYPNPGMLLYHSVGTGKCHAKDTPILMYDGSIKMVQDIEIGDLLMGDDSTPRRVLSLAQGEDEMYDIIPTKGDKYTVNSEHILVLKYNSFGITNCSKTQPNKPYRADYFDNKSVSKLGKGFKTIEEANKFLNKYKTEENRIVEISVKDYLNLAPSLRRELKGFRKGVEFPHRELPIDPYFIGIWLGDGSSHTSKFTTADEIILNYMTKEVGKYGLYINKEGKYDYRISGNGKVGNNFIINTLRKYNLLKNKHIPKDYLINSRENRLKLLAGLIDTDGHYDTKGNGYEITQKSTILADGILFLARSLGFAAYSKKCTKNCIYKGEKKEGIYNRIYISGNVEEIPVMIPYKIAKSRAQKKDVLVSGITVAPVGEGRYYGFTLDGNNRYLLGDFTVTHNTCCAIATASSSFEAEDYTILYVTRYTLKGDVWKNMFDQVCNVILQDKIKKGLTLPEAQAARLRLISKGWFEPLSYRQFSNMLAGKNKLYHDLIQRNGTKDPLHKTLIIIDEAHKLFAADVEGQEKADIEVIRNALHHSNEVSKADGVKMLFMTGTPYTDDPMDMMRLLNLCRPNTDKLPETFETFAEMFLDSEGHFTEEGRLQFLDKLTGYISYLNREKDVRSFSYPIFHEMPVVMSDYEYIPLIDSYLEIKNKYTHYDTTWKYNIHTSAQDVEKLKKELETNVKVLMEERNQFYKDCLTELKMGQAPLLKRVESVYKEELKKCKQDIKGDQKALDAIYKQKISDIKSELKAESKGKTKEEKEELKKQAEEAIERLKLDKDFDKEQIEKQTDHRQCLEDAFQNYQKSIEAIKIPKTKEHCEQLKKDNEIFQQKHREINERIVGRKRVQLDEQLKIDENIVKTLKEEYDLVNVQLTNQIKNDLSQRTGLENCLKDVIKPAYRMLLKGDAMLSSFSKDATPQSDSAIDNIFLISGHGNENVVNFKARWTMPQDKALIVFPVCARANYLDKICKFAEAFNDTKYLKLFRNPIKYRKQLVKIIDQPIRIYLPGDSVPYLSTNLFLDFEKDTTVLVKSGVYRIHNIPEMNRTVLRKANKKAEELGSPLCVPLSGVIEHTRDYNSTVHKEVFAGNVYKPAKEGKTFKGLKARYFTIRQILEDMGPGIYYYIGCRSSDMPVRPEAYLSIYEASEKQQEAAKRTKKISPVLKLIRGKEVVSSSSSNKSIEKEPSPTPSPEKPKKVKKEREPDNTKEERKILQDILIEIEQLMNTMENVEERIQKWNQKLEPILKTKRLENVVHKIYVLQELNKYKSTASKKLVVALENNFYKLTTVSMFKVDNKNYSFQPKLYGYLPNRIDVEEKCSSKLLVNYLKKLLTNDVMIDSLPKTMEEWDTKNFTTVCNQIRELIRVHGK